MFQDLVIMGATGKVGKELVDQIIKRGDTDKNRHKNPTRIIAVQSSKEHLFNTSGLSNMEALNFSRRIGKGVPTESPTTVLDLVRKEDIGDSNIVFVDVTDSNEILSLHKAIRSETTYGVVTANKIPITACDFSTFELLTSRFDKYGFRCSVMAGAEAVSFLRDLKELGDRPKRIIGSFSGTMGYIYSSTEDGMLHSEAVMDAYKKGYTEPHPATDLSGIDVARKMLILTRTIGFNIPEQNLRIMPCTPPEYLGIQNVEEFLNRIKERDAHFKRKIEESKSDGLVLRHVAEVRFDTNNPVISVGPRIINKDHRLGMLKGTDNKIIIESETYPNGYIVEAPGAGIEITAQNIRRDLLDQLNGRESRSKF